MSITTEASAGAAGIRPFRIETPEAELEALRGRIAATRWPHKELVEDRSQGVRRFTSSQTTGHQITIGASARRN